MNENSVAILFMLPEEFSSEVMNWCNRNITDDMLPGIKNKGREGSPHITLATDIIDESSDGVMQMVSENEPFEVELGAINNFRKLDKGYDVLKIDVNSDKLHEINKNVLGSFEVRNAIRPYNPHITICYVKPYACDSMLGNEEFKGRRIPIRSFVFSDRSAGGKVIDLKPGKGPLKDSLDYGSTNATYTLNDLKVYAEKTGVLFATMSAKDFGNAIIRLNSNKSL